MHAIEPAVRTPPEALALGRALVSRAEREKTPQISASLTHAPAVVLGAAQRAGRVVDLESCRHAGVTVLRRTTTGVAAWLGGRAFVFTIALPHIASLFPDATARTLLNRNVRPLLKGFSRAGVAAHYFGRDFLTLRQRPAALLGFDVAPSGAVLLEVFAGYDEPMAVPDALVSHDERALDRWTGKRPASLAEILPGAHPGDIARAVLAGFADRVGISPEAVSLAPGELDPSPFQPITDANDPLPAGLRPGPAVPVPIGWVEAAVEPATGDRPPRVWLGGDILAPRWALERIGERALGSALGSPPLGDIPLEGATLSDLVQAVANAIS
jgi:hypothetical protein